MLDAISSALSGLNAASQKIRTGANNIANLSSAGALAPENGPAPYSTQQTVQTADPNGGVQTQTIPKDPGFVESFAPDSPFANEDGFIGVPNTDLAEEAVNLKLAETAYKASLATLETANEMNDELLSVFDRDA